MRRILYCLLICLLGWSLSIGVSSCKTGYGCPAEEQYKEKQSKPLSKKRGKSRLFKEG